MRSRINILGLALLLAGTFTVGACNRGTEMENTNGPRAANTNRAIAENTNTRVNTTGDNDNDEYSTADGVVTAKTKLALIADDNAPAFDIDVDTVNGVVTLSGKVNTAQAKSAAERVAKGIDGAKSVNNQLQVVPNAREDVVADKDENIKDNIDNMLDNQTGIKDLDLSAEVNAGVVTLQGEVDRYGELLRAADAVRDVKGVKRVVTTSVRVNNGAVAATTNTNRM